MTSKEQLRLYKNWFDEKLNLLHERDQIIIEEALPAGIDYSADRVQTAPEDGMLKKILRITKRTKEIDKRIEYLTMLMENLKDKINAIPSPYNRLLYLRYVALMSWDDISKVMGYDEDHVRGTMHDKALASFQKFTQKTTKSHGNPHW